MVWAATMLGFSEYELEALRIPGSARDECLKHLVPYRRCFDNHSLFAMVVGEYISIYSVHAQNSKEIIVNAQFHCMLVMIT